MMKFTAIDLFSGCGGFHCGLKKEGFHVVGAVEISPIHCQTYSKNFPDTRILNCDIITLNPLEIAKSNNIDLIVGGPPCQGFSDIGKKNFADSRNNLILEFARFVIALYPKYFIMENVRGILHERYKPLIGQFKALLEEAGYKIDWQILDAKYYGVPQSRKRVFFLGHRLDVPQIFHPAPQIFKPYTTVRDALWDLPEPENYPELRLGDSCIAEWKEECSEYARLMRDCNSSAELLTNSRLAEQKPGTRERFAFTKPGTQEPISKRQRLDANHVAPTIRAGTGKEGRYTALLPIHPWRDRVITVREAARLQSFQDSFKFHPSKLYGGQQVGNAVPPLLAAAVVRPVKEILYELANTARGKVAISSDRVY